MGLELWMENKGGNMKICNMIAVIILGVFFITCVTEVTKMPYWVGFIASVSFGFLSPNIAEKITR